jgi:hypothetical protein
VAAFVFLGGPECGVDELTWLGVRFRVGVPAEVADAAFAEALRRNRFFSEVHDEPAGAVTAPVSSPDVEPKRRGRTRRV